MLRIPVKAKPRKLSKTFGPCSGPKERIERLRLLVTSLMRYERIETTIQKCDETRGYAERLIQIAIQNGDRHRETMEMADFWLLEKDLIHKLFKVVVPRFDTELYRTQPYTDIYRLPTSYSEKWFPREMGVLELKGNPWPPIKKSPRDNKHQLQNILIKSYKDHVFKSRPDFKETFYEKRPFLLEESISELNLTDSGDQTNETINSMTPSKDDKKNVLET